MMTQEELEALRIKAQLEALRVLMRMLYTGLANSSSSAAIEARAKFAALRQEHGRVVLSDRSAVESDMVTAEFQEALDDLLTYIESGIKS